MTQKTELHEELLEIADRLERQAQEGDFPTVKEPLEQLENAAATVGKAWSGSWLGYHARVYYDKLQPPPAGAHFRQEWGLMDTIIQDTCGDWRELNGGHVERAIYQLAQDPDLKHARHVAEASRKAVENDKSEVLSLLSTALSDRKDEFLAGIKKEVENTSVLTQSTIIEGMKPSGQIMTRDMVALGQGYQTPPHISVWSLAISLRQPSAACAKLAQLARKAGSHLARQNRKTRRSAEIGISVFIGHGRSLIWRELKDFVQDRLHLPWDEFNRIPVAGVTNISRLSEMLDAAAIAFLVMTGEDEQADGKAHARMNVVHEAGLFQGRLGFTRAIVILEEGCEEFGNIHGLGQIRFPKGKIKAAFDEIRQVLEREGLLVQE